MRRKGKLQAGDFGEREERRRQRVGRERKRGVVLPFMADKRAEAKGGGEIEAVAPSRGGEERGGQESKSKGKQEGK